MSFGSLKVFLKEEQGHMVIQRQVQVISGSLVILGALLALYVHLNWIFFSLAVGAGIALAGVVGFCPLAMLLQKMSWNQPSGGEKR